MDAFKGEKARVTVGSVYSKNIPNKESSILVTSTETVFFEVESTVTAAPKTKIIYEYIGIERQESNIENDIEHQLTELPSLNFLDNIDMFLGNFDDKVPRSSESRVEKYIKPTSVITKNNNPSSNDLEKNNKSTKTILDKKKSTPKNQNNAQYHKNYKKSSPKTVLSVADIDNDRITTADQADAQNFIKKTLNDKPSSLKSTPARNEKVSSSSSSVEIPASTETPSTFKKQKPFHNVNLSLKDRFNYVSADCGAVILHSNKEAAKVSSILSSKKDSYMLNLCSAKNKYVVVELCEDILIDTFTLANHEFFSSGFKDIKMYASDRYPPKDGKWSCLGEFTANNTRITQTFRVPKPKLWAKYIKLQLLTHFGNQHFCPVSMLAVYGTTQMEKYRYEAEEEEIRKKQAQLEIDTDEISTKTQKPFDKLRIHGNAASTLIAYINDFEKILFDIPQEADKNNYKQISFSKANSPPWAEKADHIEDTDKQNEKESNSFVKKATQASSEGGNNSQKSKTYIPITRETPKNNINPHELLDSMSQLHDEKVHNAGNNKEEYNPIFPKDGYTDSSEDQKQKNNEEEKRKVENEFVNISKQEKDKDIKNERVEDGKIINNLPKKENADKKTENLHEGGDNVSGNDDDQDNIKDPAGSYDSIYKKITRRLEYLESNVTMILGFVEEQTDYFNQVLARLHLKNLEYLNKSVFQLNKTTTKQIKSLVDISEEIWRTILFDIEAYQQNNVDEINELAKKIENISNELEFERRVNLSQILLLFAIVLIVILNRFTGITGAASVTDQLKNQAEFIVDNTSSDEQEQIIQQEQENEGEIDRPELETCHQLNNKTEDLGLHSQKEFTENNIPAENKENGSAEDEQIVPQSVPKDKIPESLNDENPKLEINKM
ncbi:hypothetical protein BB559_000978 [Furculomyces boomerangus]|uniref:SUN domain-containing protein n=1 Tax=Furculomyces boomerangus TaxID=61424 RepID=A0A2T9Z3G8_9FUNG|nr:hypothetical protein BB559_000978 [Furculomyces boomerangus]